METPRAMEVKICDGKGMKQQENYTTPGGEQSDNWNKLSRLLFYRSSIKTVYKTAFPYHKQMLIKGRFKYQLSYFEAKLSTASIEPAFSTNALKVK